MIHALGSFTGSVVIGCIAHAVVVWGAHTVVVTRRVFFAPRFHAIERRYAPHVDWLNPPD